MHMECDFPSTIQGRTDHPAAKVEKPSSRAGHVRLHVKEMHCVRKHRLKSIRICQQPLFATRHLHHRHQRPDQTRQTETLLSEPVLIPHQCLAEHLSSVHAVEDPTGLEMQESLLQTAVGNCS
eukprot:scpid49665/ scgid20289/ 